MSTTGSSLRRSRARRPELTSEWPKSIKAASIAHDRLLPVSEIDLAAPCQEIAGRIVPHVDRESWLNPPFLVKAFLPRRNSKNTPHFVSRHAWTKSFEICRSCLAPWSHVANQERMWWPRRKRMDDLREPAAENRYCQQRHYDGHHDRPDSSAAQHGIRPGHFRLLS